MSESRFKFRAWNNGQMSKPFTLGEGVCWPCGRVSTANRVGAVMQWTGLYDANGAEIYEGDLVAASDLHDRGDGMADDGVLAISWCQTMLQFVGVDDRDDRHDLSQWSYDDGETTFTLAGNIYENPEPQIMADILDAVEGR